MERDAFLLPVLTVAVAAAVVASEVVVRTSVPKGPVHITYWEKWTGFEYDGIKATVDDFNKSQDRIHVDLLTISDLANKTMMSISGGIPPDVAGLWGTNLAQYADDHAVIPLDDFCREAGIKKEDYIPAYWGMCDYRGHVYCLPSTPASIALHYNVDLLENAGFDPSKPPQTFEQLAEMADKLTTREKDGRIKISGFLPSEPGWWNWCWGYYWGGSLWDGESKITANAPENVKALEWVQSFSKKYGPGEIQTFRSGFGNFSSPQNAFMTGNVAMEQQGVWMHNFVSMYAPKLKWGAAPMPYPAGHPELAEATVVDMDILVIPRGAKHPKEAFEFIKYVQSQPAMEKLCLSHRKNSPLAKISDDFWRRHENPYIRLFDRLAKSKNAFANPQLGIWTEYGAEMGNAFDEVSLLKATPKEALDRVTKRMQPKLDQYLRRLKMRGEAP